MPEERIWIFVSPILPVNERGGRALRCKKTIDADPEDNQEHGNSTFGPFTMAESKEFLRDAVELGFVPYKESPFGAALSGSGG